MSREIIAREPGGRDWANVCYTLRDGVWVYNRLYSWHYNYNHALTACRESQAIVTYNTLSHDKPLHRFVLRQAPFVLREPLYEISWKPTSET